jgi:hypothetical protein
MCFRKCWLARAVSFTLLLIFTGNSSGLDKKVSEWGAQTRAEKVMVAGLRKNGEANLQLLPVGERTIRGSFLKEILLNHAESEIPSRIIRISGATVEGVLRIQGEREAAVSRTVVFSSCNFDGVWLHSAHFEQGLTFARSSFRQGLFLERTHVKGDLLLSGIKPATEGDDIRIILDDAHIDGQLMMQSLNVSAIQARRLTAQSVRLDLTPGSRLKKVDFSQLEVESVTIADYHIASTSPLSELWLSEASIKKTLRLSHVVLGELHAPGLRVDGRTDVEDGVGIQKSIDLAWASLGTFEWGVVECDDQTGRPCWPADRDNIRIGAMSLRDISIRPYFFPDPVADSPPAWGKDESLQFLDQAAFSESAYASYEQLLRNRGLIAEADNVYRGMRAHKRAATWQASQGFLGKMGAAVYITIDLIQKVLLGYGRSALQPLLWSLAFVAFGTVVFRSEKRMEVIGEHPPQFSAFWYSLELFLPVVDLGVAKNWRPARRSFPLLTYARVHQLAGWILIPVALAALTGAFK